MKVITNIKLESRFNRARPLHASTRSNPHRVGTQSRQVHPDDTLSRVLVHECSELPLCPRGMHNFIWRHSVFWKYVLELTDSWDFTDLLKDPRLLSPGAPIDIQLNTILTT